MLKSTLTALSTPFEHTPSEPVRRASTGARLVCDEAVTMIVSFEKLHRLGADNLIHPYWDMIGYPTIGIGHLLSKVKYEDLSKYPPITLEAAHVLHEQDLDKFANGVSRHIKVPVSDNQFGAIVSLAFNVGLGNLQASTLIRKLNRGDSLVEVADEFLKWDKAGGKKVRGLTRRRIAERKLFLC